MTGGVAVILGKFGDNFGAGMTRAMAYLYDPDAEHTLRLNGETVIAFGVGRRWEAQLGRWSSGTPARPAARGRPRSSALGGGAAEVPPDRAERDAEPAWRRH